MIRKIAALWRSRMGAALHGFPISYAVNDQQYLAVPTGLGVFRALTSVISPDIFSPKAATRYMYLH